MQQEPSLQELVEQLGSSNRAIRYSAYVALQNKGQAVLGAAVEGLKHSNPQMRRWCADLMDHLGDDRCIAPLIELTKDTVPKVRRQTVHSLSCQRCKPTPLNVDLTDLLIEIGLHDHSLRVRGEALYGLSFQPPSQKAIVALEAVIKEWQDRQSLSKPERFMLGTARWSLRRQQQTIRSLDKNVSRCKV